MPEPDGTPETFCVYPRNSRSHGKEEARSPVGSTGGPLRHLIMKKWIITGGAGFIGCHAAARLHAAGHCVVLVDNLSRRGAETNLAWLRARGVTDFVWADIRDAHAMHALLARHADADAVLHLAAQVAVTTSVADPRTDFAVNALAP
jgi:CDP-paratose 2-epimerase